MEEITTGALIKAMDRHESGISAVAQSAGVASLARAATAMEDAVALHSKAPTKLRGALDLDAMAGGIGNALGGYSVDACPGSLTPEQRSWLQGYALGLNAQD